MEWFQIYEKSRLKNYFLISSILLQDVGRRYIFKKEKDKIS